MDIQVCFLFSISSDTVCICKNRSSQASFLSLGSLRCPFCVHQLARLLPLEQILQLTHSSPTSSTSNAIATVASTSDRSKSTSKAKLNSNPHPLIQLWSRTSVPGDQDSTSSNRPRISPGHQDGQRTTSWPPTPRRKDGSLPRLGDRTYVELGTQVGICQLDSLENPADGSMCTCTVLR